MYKKLKLVESINLNEAPDDEELEDIVDKAKEDLDAKEDLEDTIDSEEDQEENPVNEESELDKQLNDLRDVLVDLDLNLYQITSKEDKNNSIYIIGKVAEDNNDTLMLIDTKPEEVNNEDNSEEEPIIDNIETDIDNSVDDSEEHETELEERFDFVKLPLSFDEINRLNPRYGNELTPDHEAIMEYLMNCLIELNPEAAEELQNNKDISDENIEEPSDEDINLDIDIEGEEDLEDEE